MLGLHKRRDSWGRLHSTRGKSSTLSAGVRSAIFSGLDVAGLYAVLDQIFHMRWSLSSFVCDIERFGQVLGKPDLTVGGVWAWVENCVCDLVNLQSRLCWRGRINPG